MNLRPLTGRFPIKAYGMPRAVPAARMSPASAGVTCTISVIFTAAERKRAAAARKRHLASVMKRADPTWAGLDPLMDQKIASAYDDAAAQLKELRDAYKQAAQDADFQDRLTLFRQRYIRRPAMMRRIKEL